ncbi:putative protease [uncultured Caudovirales phage]|uniref:Putative protease n=1 Tax=uncultured Caudovirales phage TaxID=2100421 RepID=A0A6J5LFE6_9CAUD|nr:putative protease [uncultured Caudovirales phage]
MAESMMTDTGATTTEAPPTSTAATDAATTTTDTATQQQATEGTTAPTTTDAGDAQKTEGEQESTSDKPTGAPEKYEFTVPDGVNLDEAGLASFSEFAKELDMPQEAAQKMLEKMGPAWQQRQADAISAVQNQWKEASTSDKEFGGEKLNENLAVAKKALDTFGTPELSKLLRESGIGNHPEIIRAFYRAGKAISEDSFVAGAQGKPSSYKDPAKSLYPNQQS